MNKMCMDLEYQTDKNLTVTQDVEKAKPELWGMCGRLPATGTTRMERDGGAAP